MIFREAAPCGGMVGKGHYTIFTGVDYLSPPRRETAGLNVSPVTHAISHIVHAFYIHCAITKKEHIKKKRHPRSQYSEKKKRGTCESLVAFYILPFHFCFFVLVLLLKFTIMISDLVRNAKVTPP